MSLSIIIEIESVGPLLLVDAKDFSETLNAVTRKVEARLPNVNLIVWQRIILWQGEGEHRWSLGSIAVMPSMIARDARRRHYTDRGERNRTRPAFRSAIGSTVSNPCRSLPIRSPDGARDLMLSSAQILSGSACNLKRLGKTKNPHNHGKIKAAAQGA
jgi:hypothetical protein